MGLNLPRKTGTILDKIMFTLFIVACLLLAGIVLIVSLEVVLRYFMRSPMGFVSEVVSYALVALTFLSAAWILKLDKHVRIDFVTSQLKPRQGAVLNIFTAILSAGLWLVIAWYSGQLTWHLFQTGEKISHSLLTPPKAPLVAVVPIGSFLLFVQSVRWVYTYLRGWRALPEQEEKVVI